MYNFRNFLPGRGPYPFLIAFCATRDHLAPSRSRDLFLVFVFSETKASMVMHRHHVLKQIRGLVRIPIRNAPIGRKCQCSTNFARWKKNYLKSSAKLYFKLPPKNAKISKCKAIKFLPIPGLQWDWCWQK